jgi:hypothetical protein
LVLLDSKGVVREEFSFGSTYSVAAHRNIRPQLVISRYVRELKDATRGDSELAIEDENVGNHSRI